MKISSKYLHYGMELNEDIKELNLFNGQVLLNESINILKENNYDYIDIKVSSEFDTINLVIRRLIKNILESDNIDELHDLSLFLKEIVASSKELKFDTGIYLRSDDNHVVNTIIIASLLAKKYNDVTEHDMQVDLESTIYAAILADIGRRAKTPDTLKFLNKEYKSEIKEFKKLVPDLKSSILSEYDSKYHPIYSYFFCKYYKTSDNVKMAVLLHHEKESGTSSLLNTPLDSQESNEYARIARILKLADLFDIIYRNNVLSNQSDPFSNIGRQIDTIVASSFVNARLANILKTIIPIYQIGMRVQLSDGTIGVVSDNDANDYNNPTLVDLNGEVIDLRKENIRIIKQAN